MLSDSLYTTVQAAKYIGRHPERVRELVREGKLVPAAQIGRAWVFTREALDAWKTARGTTVRERPDALDRALLAEAEKRMADPDEEFVPYERARSELGL